MYAIKETATSKVATMQMMIPTPIDLLPPSEVLLLLPMNEVGDAITTNDVGEIFSDIDCDAVGCFVVG